MADHSSVVRLLQGVPLNRSYADTLDFASADAQSTYFASKQIAQFNDVMYVKNAPIIIPNVAGAYKQCNYLMFQNPDMPGKWFYAFVTSVEFLANDTTQIDYVIDYLQTWYFEMTVKQCFVVREHVNNDAIGANLKEESVATGEYIVNASAQHIYEDWWLVVVTSVLFSSQDFPPAEGYVYSGSYSGVAYYCYDLDDINKLAVILEALAGEAKSDAIISMYMVPKDVVNSSQQSGKPMAESLGLPDLLTAPSTGTLDGYTPRNKKLLTYPYRGLKVTNNCGGTAIMRYEFFSGNPSLTLYGSPFPNGRVLAYPVNYAGRRFNLDYSVPLGDYPQCSWIKDVYSNWLATQSVKWGYEAESRERAYTYGLAKDVAVGIEKILTGGHKMAEGNAMSSAFGLFGGFIDSVQAEEQAQAEMAMEKQVAGMTPPSAQGSVGNESTNKIIKQYGFVAMEMTITAEYAKSIDGYFDLFGYRVDQVKVPNIKGRQSWNYVKTMGAIVQGTAPVEAMELYQALLDRGIRFWHNTDVGNYSLANGVVS